MNKHAPGSPGNTHTYLEDRPAWIERIERGVFYAVVPAGAILVIALTLGIAVAEVSKWIG